MNGIISPNMLKTYELCPKKFYFRYVKKISIPTDDNIFEAGKNIHALASYYLKKENIDKMEKSLSIKEKDLWLFLKTNKYFDLNLVGTEYNLAVKINNNFYGGRLDALLKNNNSDYYILDYKTGKAPQNAEFDYQTIIYLLAVKEFFKTNSVTFIYIDLKNKNEVKIELTKELENEYKSKLIKIADAIKKGDFQQKFDNCPCEYDILCY